MALIMIIVQNIHPITDAQRLYIRPPYSPAPNQSGQNDFEYIQLLLSPHQLSEPTPSRPAKINIAGRPKLATGTESVAITPGSCRPAPTCIARAAPLTIETEKPVRQKVPPLNSRPSQIGALVDLE